MRVKAVVLAFFLVSGLSWGKAADECEPSTLNIPGAQYPCIYPDRRVTFRLMAPEAKQISVQLGKKYDMTRGTDGMWSVTVPPQVVTTVLGVLIMMLTISWQMTLVALALLPLSFGIIAFIVNKSQVFFKSQQDYLGHINGHVEEMYGNHLVMKAFNGEAKSMATFDGYNNTLYGAAWRSQFLSGMMMPIMNFIGNLGYVAVVIMGGWLAVRNAITLGDIQAFIQYVRSFTQPITQLANISNILQQTAAKQRDAHRRPIVASDPLFPEEPVLGVRGLGEAPFGAQVRAEPDDEDAVAVLRDAVFGGVEQTIHHPIRETVRLAAGVLDHPVGLEPGRFGEVVAAEARERRGHQADPVRQRRHAEDQGVGRVHDGRAQQHAHRVQVVSELRHQIAGAGLGVIPGRKAHQVAKQVVAQVVFDVA